MILEFLFLVLKCLNSNAKCVVRDGNEIKKADNIELKKTASLLFWNCVVSKQISAPPD
jgi:hypothetical protein